MDGWTHTHRHRRPPARCICHFEFSAHECVSACVPARERMCGRHSHPLTSHIPSPRCVLATRKHTRIHTHTHLFPARVYAQLFKPLDHLAGQFPRLASPHSYALPPTERMVVLSPTYTSKSTNFSITNLLGDVNGKAATYSANLPRKSRARAAQQRIKANARERGRVHTIGAAFEALRRSVPVAGECKLTKLSVLRIAAAYIETLVACLEANRLEEREDETVVMEKPEDLSCTTKASSDHPPSGATAMVHFNYCSHKLVKRIQRECRGSTFHPS